MPCPEERFSDCPPYAGAVTQEAPSLLLVTPEEAPFQYAAETKTPVSQIAHNTAVGSIAILLSGWRLHVTGTGDPLELSKPGTVLKSGTVSRGYMVQFCFAVAAEVAEVLRTWSTGVKRLGWFGGPAPHLLPPGEARETNHALVPPPAPQPHSMPHTLAGIEKKIHLASYPLWGAASSTVLGTV
ncbi:hypothetical protein CB1_000597048 [Camelus ferus]|nr:hypothetical protein CB1_000597048 [Camelus ferus]